MPNKKPSTFRKSDVKRAIQAAEGAKMKIARIEIDKSGKIVIFPSDDAEATNVERGDQWDTALK